MKDVPTEQELEDAHDWAIKQLCIEIPNTVGSHLTRWDRHEGTCKFTEEACTPGELNPISQIKFDVAGNELEINRSHRLYGKFWKKYEPDFLVYKGTKFSPHTPVCSRGNYLLKQWCNYPKTRNDERRNDGKKTKGVTNAKPFIYLVDGNGKETCDIPKEYCDDKGISFDENNLECYVTNSQKWGEFFSSTHLVRSIKRS
jgi:hypothetical protein